MTGDARRALDANGRFILPAVAPEGFPQIGEARAEALADAYAREYPALDRANYESGHGAPIDFTRSRRCGRTLYARPSYEPPANARRSLLRLVAGHFITTFCGDGAPQFIVAVSSANTDVEIAEGQIVWPMVQGGAEFASYPIPRRLGAVPVSPERAAELAARFAGRRVASVPELMMPARPEALIFARWRVGLEASIRVRGDSTHEVVDLQALYVGLALNDYSEPARPRRGIGAGDPSTRWEKFEFGDGEIVLRRKPDAAMSVEAITLVPGDGR